MHGRRGTYNLYADFDNYKKRKIKEYESLSYYAEESILLDLLPLLDDMERGIEAISSQSSISKDIKEGAHITHQKLLSMLVSHGLMSYCPKAGDNYDSEEHEALSQRDTKLPELKGKVLEVIEKGYRYKDKILRYAKVIVGC